MAKYKKKYGLGTSKINIEDPKTVLAQNDIDLIKGREDSMSNPFIQALQAVGTTGTSMAGSQIGQGDIDALMGLFAYGGMVSDRKMKMAMGGQVPVEVEGNEVAQAPNGMLTEFDGPSHEQGGIDANLAEGTKVYSDRITIEGKTLAERKKDREKSISKFNKILKEGYDPLAEKSKKRAEDNNKTQEEFDLNVQKLANAAAGNPEKMALGSGPEGIDPPDNGEIDMDYLSMILSQSNPQFLNNPQLDMFTPNIQAPNVTTDNNNLQSNFLGGLNNLGIGLEEMFSKVPSLTKNIGEGVKQGVNQLKENTPGYTGGDLLGIGASLYQGVAPLLNTYKERATDTPNENYFKNYGEESLKEYDNLQGTMESLFESQVDRLAQSKRTQQANNSLGAKGINQKRALNLAGEQQFQSSSNDAMANFNKQLMSIGQGKAALKSQIDSTVMGGEREADIANRMDKAAFYTERGKDIVGLTESLQSVAGNVNEAKYRDSMQTMINAINDKYEINITMDGIMSYTKEKKARLEKERQAELDKSK